MAKKASGEKLLPLIEQLQVLDCDGRLKSVAFTFLRCDMSQLKTEQDFRTAFDGLLAVGQLLTPLHPGYRNAVDEMRKGLVAYHKINKWLLPDEAVTLIENNWKALCQTFQKHLPSEAWQVVEKITTEAFSDVRRLLEDSKA